MRGVPRDVGLQRSHGRTAALCHTMRKAQVITNRDLTRHRSAVGVASLPPLAQELNGAVSLVHSGLLSLAPASYHE